jgi:hypothetical protein
MTNSSPSAFGLYPSSRTLHLAADALRSAQFRQTDISIMYSDGSRAYQLRESSEVSGVADDHDDDSTLGGMLSTLSGVGAFATNDEGPFLAAGPILAQLESGGSALSPSLRGLGIPEGSLERFAGSLKNGELLLLVQCEDGEWAARALRILRETGAREVEATTATAADAAVCPN